MGDGGVVRDCIDMRLFSFASRALGLSIDMRLKSRLRFEDVFGDASYWWRASSSSGLEEASDQRDSQGAGTVSLSCEGKGYGCSSGCTSSSEPPVVVTIGTGHVGS